MLESNRGTHGVSLVNILRLRGSSQEAPASKRSKSADLRSVGGGSMSQEHGGKIVSILAIEYDVEKAKQIFAEEQIEEKMIEIARKMLKRGTPIEIIAEDTGLDEFTIHELKNGLYKIGT